MKTNKKTPRCVGVILDGNRRWAKKRGLPIIEGHKQGAKRLRETIYWMRDRRVRNLVVYLFSNENWNRSKEEISYLINLFQLLIGKYFDRISKDGIRIRFAGERDRFNERMQKSMLHIEKESANNRALTLWACLSYGGRSEIVSAAAAAAKKGIINERSISDNLWTSGMPDPDIIIRTGGEKRLSGFLTWQSVYSELFFLDEYWPDFSEKALDSVLEQYKERERRMGR